MAEANGNDNVSLFDIEDEIDMSLTSQGTVVGLEVALNLENKCVWQTLVPQLQ
jgi:hypothetical protein